MLNRISLFIAFAVIFSMVACSTDSSSEKAEVSEEGVEAKASEGAQTYAIDADASKIMWEGYKPAYSHNGTVGLKSGMIKVNNGKIEAGSFVIDMTTINCLDLEGEKKAGLESHLMGTADEKKTDFFNVTEYPTATFELTEINAIEDTAATHKVSGNLSMLDSTKQISFKANIAMMDNQIKITSPTFAIDRTDWGIQFMSKSFIDDLKDNFIKDEFDLKLDLIASAGNSQNHVEDHDPHEGHNHDDHEGHGH